MKTIRAINNINIIIGKAVSWLTLAMVLLMFFNVIARYIFSLNLIWQQELVIFMHAIIFLAGGGYTLLCNKHVRVDIFYQKLSEKGKAIVNIAGTILLLIPVSGTIIYFSYDFVISSWQLYEKSPEYNGVHGIFILKTFIWIFASCLILQGVSVILTGIKTIRER